MILVESDESEDVESVGCCWFCVEAETNGHRAVAVLVPACRRWREVTRQDGVAVVYALVLRPLHDLVSFYCLLRRTRAHAGIRGCHPGFST